MRCRRVLFFAAFFFSAQVSCAQELFVYSEPASNIAANSLAIRVNNYLRESSVKDYAYSNAASLRYGISPRSFISADIYFQAPIHLSFSGAAIYYKYRFYAKDKLHGHFRMAAYARLAAANAAISQPAIEEGKSSAAEAGIIATKLLHKTALSAGTSFIHAFDNSNGNKFSLTSTARNAFNYNLSFGKLLLPKIYKNYRQINFNAMLEMSGQINTGSGKSFLDIAPSGQLIFLSKIRLDAGYRLPAVHSLPRCGERGFLLRLEYNFFNAFK